MMRKTECNNLREAIAALVMGELAPSEEEQVRRHLEGCEGCRRFRDDLAEQEKEVRAAFDLIARDVESIKDSLAVRLEQQPAQPKTQGVALSRRILKGAGRMILTHKRMSAAAAVLVAAFGLAIYLVVSTAEPAYALEQTGEALKSVRFMHISMRDEKGSITDERWIEITPAGRQGRYWQKSRGINMAITVADDGKTCRVYRADKKTVILHKSREGGLYQWFGDLGGLLRDLAGKGEPGAVEVQTNVTYKSRKAHRVRLMRLNLDCYIDPATKLPMAVGQHEVAYGQPPKGIFEKLSVPKGTKVVDLRSPVKPDQLPEWMKQDQAADSTFTAARRALAKGDYKKAADLFTEVVKVQPKRNWAVFWLADAHYKLGKYDAAIEAYTKVIGIFGEDDPSPDYCYLARGLAYAANGDKVRARKDFARALPTMIKALRYHEVAIMFEYADDPLLRDRDRGSIEAFRKHAQAKGIPNMILRLRKVTGRNFGYDPAKSAEQNEKAISEWENWWRKHAAEYGAKEEGMTQEQIRQLTELSEKARKYVEAKGEDVIVLNTIICDFKMGDDNYFREYNHIQFRNDAKSLQYLREWYNDALNRPGVVLKGPVEPVIVNRKGEITHFVTVGLPPDEEGIWPHYDINGHRLKADCTGKKLAEKYDAGAGKESFEAKPAYIYHMRFNTPVPKGKMVNIFLVAGVKGTDVRGLSLSKKQWKCPMTRFCGKGQVYTWQWRLPRGWKIERVSPTPRYIWAKSDRLNVLHILHNKDKFERVRLNIECSW